TALFTNGEVGLSSLVAIGLSLAILSAVAQVGRAEMRPPVICLALWYVTYSIATTKYGRYLGTIMPLIAVLGGLAASQSIAATHFQSVWLRRAGLAVLSVAFAW